MKFLAALDANQSFLPCYPHLHGLWNAHLYAWLTASCICKFKIHSRNEIYILHMKHLGAADVFATDASKYASTFCSVNFNRDTTFDGANLMRACMNDMVLKSAPKCKIKRIHLNEIKGHVLHA